MKVTATVTLHLTCIADMTEDELATTFSDPDSLKRELAERACDLLDADDVVVENMKYFVHDTEKE